MYTGGTGGGTGARGQYLLEEKENGFGGGQILKPRQTAGEKISSCTGTPPDSLASRWAQWYDSGHHGGGHVSRIVVTTVVVLVG